MGDTLRYQVVVANDNSAPLSGVVIKGDLPAFTTYVPGSTALNSIPVLDRTDIVIPAPLQGDGLSIGSIPANNSSTIAYDVVVGSLPYGVYTVVAQVAVTTDSGSDLLTTESEVAGTLLHAQASTAAARSGDSLTYSIATAYAGADLLQNVVITTAIPAGTTYVPGSVNGGGRESGGVVTWTLGSNTAGVSAVTPGGLNGPQMVTGYYTGNGTDNRAITGLGFQPDVVLIKRDNGSPAIIRTSSMSGDGSRELNGAYSMQTNRIQTLDANGFTLGNNDSINKNGDLYYYTAWKAVPGDLAVGSYVGTGIAQTINAGLQPDFVMIMGDGYDPYFKNSAMPSTASYPTSSDQSERTDHITDLTESGFTVSGVDDVNKSGTTFYYAAWRAIPGLVQSGSFTGDGTDNRNITGVGFQPKLVFLRARPTQAQWPAFKMDATGADTDATQSTKNINNYSNGIQQLLSDGFQVGTDDQVNRSGEATYWTSFASGINRRATGAAISAVPTLITAGDLITVTQTLTQSEKPAYSGTVDVRISTSADDAEEMGPTGVDNGGPGNSYLVSTDLELVEDIEPTTSGTQTVGVRFNGIGVPQGATIANATITFHAVAADSPNTNNNSASLTIQGQAADNPAEFTTAGNPNYDISTRPRTSASVGWGPEGWTVGTSYSTPDLAAMVQEIVNRAGWVSGNSMAFIITGTGSRSAASYDSDPATAPLLHIDWTMPAGYPTDLVTPTLVLTGTNGISATLVSSPTPASAIVGSTGATYTWVYQVTDDGNIGQLTFGGNATDGTNVWPMAQSKSVIVHPPLTFQTSVNNPATVEDVRVVAFISDGGDLLSAHASNTTLTILPASLGGRVWNDQDGDAIQDPGEAGIDGVTVLLTDSQGNTSPQAVDGDGRYNFTGLDAGVYTITLDTATVPTVYEFLTTRLPLSFNLSNGEAVTSAALGLRARSSSIGDTLYYDTDGDGVQDPGEPGLGNISLDLYLDDGDGVFEPVPALGSDTYVASTVSNAAGAYRLDAPVVGNYFVDVTDDLGLLAGLAHTVGGQSVTDPSPAIPVAVGQTVQSVDFGYLRLPSAGHAILGDQVWVDENGDGVRQLAEPVVIDTQICATPNVGGEPLCTQTDVNGRYLLDLPAGGYTVVPTDLPLGLSLTTESPLAVVLADGSQNLTGDFGFGGDSGTLGSIGGQIWQDLPVNEQVDGFYDSATEPGLPDVSVDLILDRNNDGAWDSGDVYVATLSDMGGIFRFKGLLAGAYLAKVSDTLHVLRRFGPTIAPTIGSAPVDNTNKAQPYAISLAAGEVNDLADFGYREYEAFGTGSTLQPGIIGDQLWYDADGNGQYEQSAGDTPLSGVTLEARSEGVVVATATTGSDGKYLLMDLPLGRSYEVVVTDLFGVLEKYQPTALGIAGQDNQNQAQPYTTFLALTSTDLKADFGYARLTSVGDRVWWDANQNGVQDAEEPGIPNVPLDLLDATNTVIRSVSTNALGNYGFKDLPKGTYTVTVNPTAFLSDGPLAGWTASPMAATVDTLDSDGDPATHRAAAATGYGHQLSTVDFGFNTASAAQVEVSTPAYVRFGDNFQISITITNTGSTWISQLPVGLDYDPAYMTLRNASPVPNGLTNTGVVTWTDGLVGAGGRLAPMETVELAPGATTELLLTFDGTGDSTGLPDETTPITVTLMGGTADPDGSAGAIAPLPVVGQSVTNGGVIIVNPTGVQLVDTGAQVAADGVHLSWRTVDESQVVGFHVWRQVGEQAPERITAEPMIAQFGGQSTGGAYALTDRSVTSVPVEYELEILLNRDMSVRLFLGRISDTSIVEPGPSGSSHQLFIPMVVR